MLERKGRFTSARPLFERGPAVALERKARTREGQIAWVEFGPGRARLIRDLGRIDNASEVCEALTLDRLGRRGFSRAVEEAAEGAAASPEEASRQDLTGLPTFTVDPATARDFDDAVSARREGDGVRLWIHIADVSAFVRPGSLLEKEAFLRANSTYVPTSVEPMLPHSLSSGVCSLSPGEDRLAVTTEMVLSGSGEVTRVSFYRSRIRSDARLDYEQLDRIFLDREQAPEPVAGPLALAREAAAVLADRRRGSSLEVNKAEPSFEFDGEGHVVRAVAETATEAHRLIEQLMVLTNEQVAELTSSRGIPSVYRVHEMPDPDRVERMLAQLASLDLPAPPVPAGMGPTAAGEIAVEASRSVSAEAARRGHGGEAYSSLILRSLKPARYLEKNLGHAGLGSDAYCHFTSPIRRFPDLFVHRALLSAVGGGEEGPSTGEAAEAALHASEREREAMILERDADDVCAAFLLERELFEEGYEKRFEGEVSGVIRSGAFVRFGGRLGDVYEGFVPARRIRGERFELNEEETSLVGSKTGRKVSLGDEIAVNVEKIDAPAGRVDLDPSDG
ncbi:MAG: RNB domain-containing ribonuclease [Solirubrobacterales bacterium]|nr:RNB domain-containing ribonuclease [Solirubrobacterales bacterium]